MPEWLDASARAWTADFLAARRSLDEKDEE